MGLRFSDWCRGDHHQSSEPHIEGMMLAILFMNIFAPFIDYWVIKAHMKRRKASRE